MGAEVRLETVCVYDGYHLSHNFCSSSIVLQY